MARILTQNDHTGVRVEVRIDGDKASAECLNCHWRIDHTHPVAVAAALREAEIHVDYFPHPEATR